MQVGPRDGFHFLQVDAQNAAHRFLRVLPQRVHPRHRHLRPAPRRAAEVHHPGAGLEKAIAVVQFQDLVGRAAAIPLALCPLHVGIVQLPFQPQGGGQLAPLGGLDPDPQFALAPARGRLFRHV